MNKQIVKQTMLSLDACVLESARAKYLEYVGIAQLDRSEPIEDDEQAHAELARDLSEAFDGTVHSHSDKIEKLAAMDFGQGRGRLRGEAMRRVFRYCRLSPPKPR